MGIGLVGEGLPIAVNINEEFPDGDKAYAQERTPVRICISSETS